MNAKRQVTGNVIMNDKIRAVWQSLGMPKIMDKGMFEYRHWELFGERS